MGRERRPARPADLALSGPRWGARTVFGTPGAAELARGRRSQQAVGGLAFKANV